MEGVKNKEHSSRSTCMHIPLIFNLLIQLKPSSLYSIGPTHSLSTNSHTSQRRILWQPSTSYHLVPPPSLFFPPRSHVSLSLGNKTKIAQRWGRKKEGLGGNKAGSMSPEITGGHVGLQQQVQIPAMPACVWPPLCRLRSRPW